MHLSCVREEGHLRFDYAYCEIDSGAISLRASMSLLRLSLVVATLAVSVMLALTNPTTDQYLGFVQTKLAEAIDRMDQSTSDREGAVIKEIFRRHSKELLEGLVRPHTLRQNWGILSRFETTALGTRLVVIGIGNQFIPVEGVDEAILTLGRRVF